MWVQSEELQYAQMTIISLEAAQWESMINLQKLGTKVAKLEKELSSKGEQLREGKDAVFGLKSANKDFEAYASSLAA